MRTWGLLLILICPAVARADHFITATLFHRSELRTTVAGSTMGPAVGWAWLPSNFGVGAGVRYGAPLAYMRPTFEGYVRGLVNVPVKWWSPLLGVEFGFTVGWGRVPYDRPAELIAAELNHDGPVYFAMHTELLRFVFGRFVVSAMGLDVGTAIPPGAALRLQFDLLSVGVRL